MAKDRTQQIAQRTRDQHWYRAKVGEPVHERVVPYAHQMLEVESSFHARNSAISRVYRGVELARNRDAVAALQQVGRGLARLNAIKAICDTFSSRLSKDRPMPGFVVDDSSWELKRKAQRYREFILGQMLETEFDSLSRRSLHDGTRFGWGWTRIDDAGDAVIAERIPVNDLLFDRRELKYGQPQQAIRVHRIARDHLAELYPDDAEAIRLAPAAMRRKDDDDAIAGPRYGNLDDYVDTFTAIRLPTGPGPEVDNGRRVICIEGATLDSEQWHEPRFPWAQFQLMDPDEGIYPDGFVAQLIDLQHRVNAIVRDIQLNLAATGRGFFLVNKANDIPVEMLAGMQPFKLSYNGSQPPQWIAPTPVSQAQVSMLDKFLDEMYSMTGVSRANAESKSSLGPGASGIALDTQYDIDSDRFRMPQANYARYRLDGGQRYLDAAARVARRRAEGKGNRRSWVAVSWKGRDAIQKLDYDKVTLKEGSYRLRIEPIGFLPDTRAGKLSVVEQLAKAGVIPQWLVPALFDEPDLAEANKIILAPYKNCLRKMDDLVDESKDIPMPEQYNDLDLELKISVAFYNWVQAERAPDPIQDRFREYCDLVTEALKKKKAANANVDAVGAQPSGGMPGGPAAMFPGATMPPPPPRPGVVNPLQPATGGIPLMPQGPLPQPPMIGGIPAAA
jgi:hypothetical protein